MVHIGRVSSLNFGSQNRKMTSVNLVLIVQILDKILYNVYCIKYGKH